MGKTVIELKNVSKTYTVYENNTETLREKILTIFTGNNSKKIKALQKISFKVEKGEFFGIIGHNGSGKSTLINIISKGIKPDKGGIVNRKGNFIRLSLGMGFNTELSAKQNIFLNGAILGLTRTELKHKVDEIIEFAELEKFKNTQIKYFSRGMRARLAFAVAVLAEAEIFLMDEFFGGVGDEKFKEKADKVFKENLLKGRTIVHVSHSMQNIEQYCSRTLVLHKGEMIGIYPPKEAVKVYRQLQKGKKEKNGTV